ncbi:FUSC family protein [Neobacillus drentensis]|uniref:FUSC family protein n=1 Tax=Neobacillus drentensis TaxID=220684 RepID=UPI001F1EE56B|nr:FUSC family protein [Neobacillus drentensis]ULT58899.1 FUSC family protein [Neobacillus drentensis]
MKEIPSISSSIIKQALSVNKKPFPWLKAFSAGVAASLPILIGLLLGNFKYGLIAGMGGFTYLYVFNIPYAQRAKKIFFVLVALSVLTALGTLVAPYPMAIAILMGLIGAAAIFSFGALRITGPSAIFFVLVFSMTTGMPVQPELALVRAGLVFLGGSLSWIIAMLGYFFDPHGPEKGVMKRTLLELATFLDSVGTERFNESRHRVMSILNEAEGTLASGYISWNQTDFFKRLYVLNNSARALFTYILENYSEHPVKLPSELGHSLRKMTLSLDTKRKGHYSEQKILQPDVMDDQIAYLFKLIYDADAIFNEPASKINKEVEFAKSSTKTVLGGAFDKNSIIFISALRFGIVTTIAAIIAFQFGLVRSYWVPLSCVAVMSGFSIVATFHRAIQRGIGTLLGILIASIILSFHPSGYLIAMLVLLLTFITELFIVKNYGLAALFFTPNALLMAESTSLGNFNFTYFASARMMDVLIGSIIGLLGVWLVGRRSASSRIPHLISKTIRSQAQLLIILFSDQGKGLKSRENRGLSKMKTNIYNLKTLYNTALGEVPADRKALDYYWTVVFSIEHLGYLLEDCAKTGTRRPLSDEILAQLLYVCETMAIAADLKRSPTMRRVPEIEPFPGIQNEIVNLQKGLQTSD